MKSEGASRLLAGLQAEPKQLPCQLLWDERGADLFARICELDDYYLTRHELALLERHLGAIARGVGPRARVIEPGSGLALKTRLLLDALETPVAYVPIEIEAQQLAATTQRLRVAYPALEIEPVCADYMLPFEIPQSRATHGRSLVFFPGSTIGNLELETAEAFLARFASLAGEGGMLLLGADSNADPATLVRAYDDREGITAEFDRNVLGHVNRVYDADFDPAAFAHRAVWDAQAHRIEMQLVSSRDQRVHVAGDVIELRRGESIVTEHCYKYPPSVLQSLLGRAGWHLRDIFVDHRDWMRLWWCVRA
jgi:dimethylhistidine N-methyltransferase